MAHLHQKKKKSLGQDLLNLVRQASAASERAMNAAKYAEMAASAAPWGCFIVLVIEGPERF